MPNSDPPPVPVQPAPVVIPAAPAIAEPGDRWNFDPLTWHVLPRTMLRMATNAELKPIERIKAAQVLATLHEQNEWAKAQERAAGARETAAGKTSGQVTIAVDVEALRTAFLGRLAPAGDAGGPDRPAKPDRRDKQPARRNRTPAE